jgi:hypothetical protein
MNLSRIATEVPAQQGFVWSVCIRDEKSWSGVSADRFHRNSLNNWRGQQASCELSVSRQVARHNASKTMLKSSLNKAPPMKTLSITALLAAMVLTRSAHAQFGDGRALPHWFHRCVGFSRCGPPRCSNRSEVCRPTMNLSSHERMSN